MKKFAFSLGTVLDYKDQVLDSEKNTLMQLRMRKNEIDAKIVALEQDFEEVNLEKQEESRKGITIPRIRFFEFQLENTRRMLKQLEKEQHIAALNVEKQIKVVIAASQEVSGLDKLKDKQLEEYNHMVAKADENVIAEYIVSKIAAQKEA